MEKVERVLEALERRSAPERRRIARAMLSLRGKGRVTEGCALDVAGEIILAGDRTLRKRVSDQRTDGARRVLVGARVPVAFAEECSRRAQEKGMSLYRFVVDALEEAVIRW